MTRKTHRLNIFLALTAGLFFSLIGVSSADAVIGSDWKAGRIIDANIFRNSTSMTPDDIQRFLNAKMPACDTLGEQPYGNTTRAEYGKSVGVPPPYVCLRDYFENVDTKENNLEGRTVPAGAKSAAQIIYDYSQTYKINPQVLIDLLQKEQTLISDDWPWPVQYRAATGYGCPDTAPCSTEYYGFSNQVRWAARMFQAISDDDPNWYSPYLVGDNFVQYNPNSNCSGTNVNIINRSTAALYSYTPYQPNSPALSNLYGTGDNCSSYGNRNFWRLFNDWFGPTIQTDYRVVVADDGTLQQYVLYNNLKQYLPSPDVKVAWNIDNMPVETVSRAYLDTLVTGPALDTVYRVNGGTQLYLADGAKRYAIQTPDMLKAWNLQNKAISNVPTGLGITPSDGGLLSYTVQDSSTGSVYMVDGVDANSNTILRRYSNPDVLFAIEGYRVPIIPASAAQFSLMNRAIATDLTSTKIAYGASEYQLISGRKLPQSSAIAPLYPGSATAISEITFNRLIDGPAATAFVRSATAPEVYIVQNGQKYHITSAPILKELLGGSSYVNTMNDAYVALLPKAASSVISTVSITPSNQYLITDGAKQAIPANLRTAYETTSSFAASDALMNTYANTAKSASPFIVNRDTGQLFMIDNSSQLRYIPSLQIADAWGAFKSYARLSADTIDDFVRASDLQGYVSDGLKSYVPVNGLVAEASSTAWNLQNPQAFSDGTLSNFTQTDPLQNVGRSGSEYYRIIGGKAYMTTDSRIAGVWGIGTGSPDYKATIRLFFPSLNMLTPYISYNGVYYIVDGPSLYSVSPALYENIARYPAIGIDPAATGLTTVQWTNPMFKNSSGGWYVIDKGTLRTFNHSVILDHWSNSGTVQVPTLSSSFIASYPVGKPIERAIKSDKDAKVYSAESSTKRWITSSETYNNLYAPYTIVSDALLNALPNGNNL